MIAVRRSRTTSAAAATAAACAVLLSVWLVGVNATLSISLASNSSAYVVLNDVAIDSFSPTTAVPYAVAADTPVLSLILQPTLALDSKSTYSFQFITGSGTSTVVTGVRVVGDLTSDTGTFLDDTALTMNVSFTCNDFGSTIISTVVYIDSFDVNTNARLPGSPQLYSFVFEKFCPLNTVCPADCSGHGVCTPTLVNSACVCDVGYESEPDCSLGFWVDKAGACPGEPVTIHWDAPGGTNYVPKPADWISVGTAQDGMTTWTTADFDTLIFGGNAMYAWIYVDGNTFSATASVPTSSMTIDFRALDSRPGVVPIAFSLNDAYASRAVTSFVLYDKLDRVNCPLTAQSKAAILAAGGVPIFPALTDDDCGGGPNDTATPRGFAANGTCQCHLPFFGARCGSGCSGSQVLTVYGRDFTSSVAPVPGEPLSYSNFLRCTWVISPPANPAATVGGNSSGIWLQLKSFSTETVTDILTIFRGTDTNDLTSVIGQYSGFYQTFSLTVHAPVITLSLATSDWNSAGWAGTGNRNWHGFDATYHGLGCPAGSQHFYEAPTTGLASDMSGVGTWSCTLCTAGKISTVPDSDNCTLCTAGSFSPAGATTCSQCGIAEFQPQVGQSSCFDCAESGYPEPYCVAPSRLTTAAQVGLTAFAALMTAGVAVSFGAVLLFRKARLVVPSTPSLLLCILLGLGGFLCSGIVIVQDASRTLCSLQIWMWNLSFHLVVSSLVLKSYRLHRIFKAHALKMTIIYDWHLWLVLAGLLIADSVVLGVWEGVSPPELTLDGRCSSGGDTGFILSMILIACKALMLVFGMWIAYQIRDIPAQFNESKQMMLGLYNLAFLCVLFVGMIYALNTTFSGAQIVILEFVGLVFGSVTTFAILFGPLFYGLWSHEGESPFRGSSGASGVGVVNRNSQVSHGGTLASPAAGRSGRGSPSPIPSVAGADHHSGRTTPGGYKPAVGAAATAPGTATVTPAKPAHTGVDIMKKLADKLETYLGRRKAAKLAEEHAREQVRALDADICRVQNEIEYYTVNPEAAHEYQETAAAQMEAGAKVIREQIRASGYHPPLSPPAGATVGTPIIEAGGSARGNGGTTTPGGGRPSLGGRPLSMGVGGAGVPPSSGGRNSGRIAAAPPLHPLAPAASGSAAMALDSKVVVGGGGGAGGGGGGLEMTVTAVSPSNGNGNGNGGAAVAPSTPPAATPVTEAPPIPTSNYFPPQS